MDDLRDQLDMMEWGDVRTIPTTNGPRRVQDLVGSPGQDFWKLWRKFKDDMRDLGISVSRDDETDEFEVSWWQPMSGSLPPAPRPKLVPGVQILNHVDDEGQHTLDALAFDILKPGQRKMVMTHIGVYDKGFPFSLDASRMGEGKTYIALALMRTLGINFGVVCPANLVTKWTDTAITPFDLEPEFVLSYEKLRLGNCEDFCTRIPMHRAVKFRWNTSGPVALVFDEVHCCNGDGTLNAGLLEAAVTNPHIFTLGLSGTAADDPTAMRALGRALGLHDGSNFWAWAKENGCREAYFGGLEFTKNRAKAYEYLGNIHRHIFPARGGRLLESDAKDGTKRPPHDVFVTSVDVPDKLPESLTKFIDEVKEARDSDDSRARTRAERRAARKHEEIDEDEDETTASAAVLAIRQRQIAELKLVPYVVEQTKQAVAEGKSVAVFCVHDGTMHALAGLLDDPLFYNGSMSGHDKTEALRQFQNHVRPVLLLNLASGSTGLDLHDLSGIHPRHSIIFPTFRAKQYAQASGRTDREGKKSKSVVELVFLSSIIHLHVMQAVQRKLDNLSLLNDGDVSELRVC